MAAVREVEVAPDLAWNLQHEQEEQQLDYELPRAPLQKLSLSSSLGEYVLYTTHFWFPQRVSPALPLPGEPREAGCSLHSSCLQAHCPSPALPGELPGGRPNAISVDICSDVISQTYPHQNVTNFTGVTVSSKCN